MGSHTDTIRIGAAVLVASLVAGCTAGSLPPVRVIDSADRGNDLEVSELRRLAHCGRSDETSAVEWIADEAGLLRWQATRGVDLIGSAPSALMPGPYAIVDHGARTGRGHGIAVSRQARMVIGRTLRLTASFIGRKPSAEAATDVAFTSPCVLVQLPASGYARIEVVDPSGKRRAIVDVPSEPVEPERDAHLDAQD